MLDSTTNDLNAENLNSTDIAAHSNIMFFTVSTMKLIIMSIATCGLYELFWFYRNWHAIRKAGIHCSPFWRAFFSPIFAYSCFCHIRKSMKCHEIKGNLDAGILAIFYIALNYLSWRLPDSFCLIPLFSFLLIIPANNIAIKINQSQSKDFVNYSHFTKWDYLAMFFGGILLTLAIVGLLAPK